MLLSLNQSADLPDWCDRAGDELQRLFVLGRLSYSQYHSLSEVALSIAVRCETGFYPWGIYDATDTLSAALSSVCIKTESRYIHVAF